MRSASAAVSRVARVRARSQEICGFALVATLCALVFAVAASAKPARMSTAPHALRLLINGKQQPIIPSGAPDHYIPVSAGKLRVQARWQGNLQGTGYRVVIATTEPTQRTYRTCTSGTSCRVPNLLSLRHGQEWSWAVTILKVRPHLVRIVSGFKLCLIGSK